MNNVPSKNNRPREIMRVYEKRYWKKNHNDPTWRARRVKLVRKYQTGPKRPEFLQYKNAAHLRDRIRVMEMLGGVVCRKCGVGDIRVLEIDHVNGFGMRVSEVRRRNIPRSGPRLVRAILDGTVSSENLQILCRPCNALEYLYRKCPDLAGKASVKWRINDGT